MLLMFLLLWSVDRSIFVFILFISRRGPFRYWCIDEDI